MAKCLTNVFSASNTALTSLAIGFAIAATEVSRYTALWTTSLVDAPAKYPVLMIFLALGISTVVLIGQKTGDTPYRNAALRIVIAVAGMAGTIARWLCLIGVIPQSAPASVLIGVGMEAPYLLMAAIAPLLLRHEPHAAMREVALGITLAGLIQLAVLAIAGSPASYMLVCMFAPASCLFLHASCTRIEVTNQDEAPAPALAWAEDLDRRLAAFLLSCALCMVALASIVIYFIHAGWSEARSAGANPSAIQLFAGLGVTAAGGILYFIAPYLRRKDIPEFCFSLIAPVLCLSLCLFNLVDGTTRIFLLVPLNIAYAALLFLTWSFSFAYPSSLRPALVSALAFFVKRAGILICPGLMILFGAMGTPPVWLAFWALVLLVCLDVAHYIVLHANRHALAPFGNDENGLKEPMDTTLASVCGSLATEKGLTPRETEVLALLARGRTAGHIAEALSVSLPTARTHIQHIYRKMGVGSQQALLDIVEDHATTRHSQAN